MNSYPYIINIRIFLLILSFVFISNISSSQVFKTSLFSYSQNSISVFKTCKISNGILSAGYLKTGTGPLQTIVIGKYDVNGDTLWIKEYLDTNSFVPRVSDIFELPNNEIAVICQHEDFNVGVSYFSYLRLDSFGNVLTYKVYFQPQSTRIDNAILTTDNSFLLIGLIDSAGPWQPMMVCIKMDITGNIVWGNTIDYYGGALYDLKIFDDGAFMIYSPSNSNLFAMDSTGNLLWSKKYGFSHIFIENGLLTDSLKNSYAIASSSNGIVLFKVDSSGTFQWAHAYGPFNQFLRRCYNFLQIENNFYLMINESPAIVDSTMKTTVLKIDYSGALNKAVKFKSYNTFNPFYLENLSSGNLLAAGNSFDSVTSLTSYILVAFDTTLTNSCWLDTSNLYDFVITTTTTNYSPSVNPFSFSDSSRSLITINQIYNISNPCLSSAISEPAVEIMIINNPIGESVCFRTDQTDIISIEIYNVNGQLVNSCQGKSNIIFMNTDYFSPGLYFAHIISKNGKCVKKLIKI